MIHDKLHSGDIGLGFGDWTTAVQQIRDSKAVRNAAEDNPVKELGDLLADPRTEKALERLVHRRNDDSHLRRVEPSELPAAVDAALADLRTLYEAADFLPDLPLIHVTAVQWDSFENLATVSYRELIGDHPVVPTRTIMVGDPGIEAGSL